MLCPTYVCTWNSVSLHSVAKGKSLFGDPASEIQELTGIVKQDIAKLNSDIAYLQEVRLTRHW